NAKELVIATVVGNAGKAVFRQVVKFVPGAGSIVGASVAGGTTVALGHAIKYIYEQDLNLNVNELNKIYKSFMKKYSEKKHVGIPGATEKVNYLLKYSRLTHRIRTMLRFPWASVEPPRALPCGVSSISYFPQESSHIPDSK